MERVLSKTSGVLRNTGSLHRYSIKVKQKLKIEVKRAKNEQIPLKVNVAKNQYKTSSIYFGMNTEKRSAGFDIAREHTVQ
jgi:hypothetical protein